MRPRIRLFSADLDGTLLGNPDAAARFRGAWEALRAPQRPVLVYNTGRTVADAAEAVAARGLPVPDYVIGGLGTELHAAHAAPAQGFQAQFGAAWDLDRIDAIVARFPGTRRQPRPFLHQFKSSWYWVRAAPAELQALRDELAQAQIRATVAYSCRYFLDVIPACAGKGKALAWLCAQLQIPLSEAAVAGDTGNDADMFLLPGVHGIVVENALPELRAAVAGCQAYLAAAAMADGVIEGLQALGVLPPPAASGARSHAAAAAPAPPERSAVDAA